jgi:hypothetical protein
MRRLPCLLVVVAGVLALSLDSAAQISSDQVPQAREVPLRESVEAQMSESRWKWGPLRVDPEVRLANVGYNANVFGTGSDEESDFTATIGLGVRTIMPLGPKLFLRADAIPEYTWFHELEDRRKGGWEAGGAFLALFNRLQVELAASTRATVDVVNSEELRPTGQEVERIYGNVEIAVLKRLALFVGAEARSTSYDPVEDDEDLDINLLDRDETLERVGLRYKFRPWASIYVMAERTDAEFPNDPMFSENEGEALLGGFSIDRDRYYVNVVAGSRTIEYPDSGVKFDEPTGSGFASFRVYGRSELSLKFHARPVYTTFVDNPYFYETRSGIGLTVPFGNRLALLGGYETGTNEYQQPIEIAGGGTLFRSDDVETWNAGLGFPLRKASLAVRYTVDSYESNIDSFSRDVARIEVSVRTSIFTLTAR